jgi:RHS repeat-associated protein
MNLLKSAATAVLLALTTLVCAAPAAAQAVEYVHTDALGSVVAVTDANRNIVERREYEPYGYQLIPTLQNGPGYTGHVQDASTGLTYMQQRYYDPLLGRFLSVDPVTMHDNGDPRLFNRYAYAGNNPYTFVDPDGRIFGVLGKVVKLAIKGGDIAATVAGAVEDAGVLFSSDATAGERLAAAASLATEVLSPVSARDAKAGYRAITGTAEEGGPNAVRTVSNIEDSTNPGSIPNIRTDVSKAEFESNLTDNGFPQSTSKDGQVNIFVKDDSKYTTRDFSNSTGGPTAEAFSAGELKSKIRLGETL